MLIALKALYTPGMKYIGGYTPGTKYIEDI